MLCHSIMHFQLQVFIELPFVLFQTTYYSLIVYSMVSFEWKVEKFFWFFFVSYFSFLYFTFYGMMTVSITPNHQVASIFAAAFYGIFNLFSGFFIPKPVSTILVWLFHILLHIIIRIYYPYKIFIEKNIFLIPIKSWWNRMFLVWTETKNTQFLYVIRIENEQNLKDYCLAVFYFMRTNKILNHNIIFY